MKKLILVLTLALCTAAAAHADPCESAAFDAAIKDQHKMYPGSEWRKSSPSSPDATLQEEKSNGFELWDVSYTVDEECMEGWTYLMRRSADGKTCAVIKTATDSSRDCG